LIKKEWLCTTEADEDGNNPNVWIHKEGLSNPDDAVFRNTLKGVLAYPLKDDQSLKD